MRTDRQTDMTKLVVAFRNFSRAPKNTRMLEPEGSQMTSQYRAFALQDG